MKEKISLFSYLKKGFFYDMNYKLIQERNPNYSPLEQVLYNRGIPIDNIDNYCNTSYLDILNPKLISNIE